MSSDGFSPLERIEFALENDALYEVAFQLPPQDPTVGGRPRLYPNYAYLLYEVAVSACGSARSAGVFLRCPLIWNRIRELVKEKFPDRPEFCLPDKPIQRHHYTYMAKKFFGDPAIVDAIGRVTLEISASQAREVVGLLRVDHPDSPTHPDRSRGLYGDGTGLTPLYRAKRGDTRIDKKTGEIREKKYEPDAHDYMAGGVVEPRWGSPFVLISARGDEPNMRMVLDVEYVPAVGGEAAATMRAIDRVAPLTPGAQFLSYDRALRGKHLQVLLRKHGLIPLVGVVAKSAAVKTANGRIPRVPKNSLVEVKDVTLADGTKRRFTFYALAGAIGIGEIGKRGNVVFVPLRRCRTRRLGKPGQYRWRNTYAIPETYGGGGTVDLRMDQTDADNKRRFSRTENVRVIPFYADKDFAQLHTLRREAESVNRSLKDTMYLRRARSVGRVPQHMNLIGYSLMVNSLTLHLARQRGAPATVAA